MKSSTSNTSKTTCWVITDGKIGTEKQCIALAEALGLSPKIIRITARAPWRFLPPALWFATRYAISDAGNMLASAWEDPQKLPGVVISATRLAAAPAAALRRHAQQHLQTPPLFIHLLNPLLPTTHFDVVVAPFHDGLRGENVLPMHGALTNITPDFMAEVRMRVQPALEQLPGPRVALLIGGNSKYYTLTPERVREMCAGLKTLHQSTGCSFMATLSRRTPEALADVFKDALAALPHVLWDGTPPNPYYDYLAWADAILVTEDSISMVADAVATGKPVYILEMQGKAPKFVPYFQELYENGTIHRFDATLTHWTYPPVLEAGRLAALLKKRFPDRF